MSFLKLSSCASKIYVQRYYSNMTLQQSPFFSIYFLFGYVWILSLESLSRQVMSNRWGVWLCALSTAFLLLGTDLPGRLACGLNTSAGGQVFIPWGSAGLSPCLPAQPPWHAIDAGRGNLPALKQASSSFSQYFISNNSSSQDMIQHHYSTFLLYFLVSTVHRFKVFNREKSTSEGNSGRENYWGLSYQARGVKFHPLPSRCLF